jgi:hypothetical protein
MDSKQQALIRLSEIFSEASRLFKILAEEAAPEEAQVSIQTVGAVTSEMDGRLLDKLNAGSDATRQLLEKKGIEIRTIGQISTEADGLLILAGVMGKKCATIKRFIDQIKRAQSSRRPISLDLSGSSQEAIADITLVAKMANQAGLLPNYRYLKSPRYKLFADAPVSPLAINFFNGQWLELYALKIVCDAATEFGLQLYPLYHVQIALPNGDQFDLDVVFVVGSSLVWVEAKTGDDFERLLPKYKVISELICASPDHAILLWSGYEKSNAMLSARGAIARMTLCTPDDFPGYVNHLLTGEGLRGENGTELA